MKNALPADSKVRFFLDWFLSLFKKKSPNFDLLHRIKYPFCSFSPAALQNTLPQRNSGAKSSVEIHRIVPGNIASMRLRTCEAPPGAPFAVHNLEIFVEMPSKVRFLSLIALFFSKKALQMTQKKLLYKKELLTNEQGAGRRQGTADCPPVIPHAKSSAKQSSEGKV